MADKKRILKKKPLDLLKPIEDTFKALIHSYTSKKYLLAMSGGIDSMVLGNLLTNMNIQWGIIHVNYNLRGKDSKADALWVKEWAESNGLPFYTKEITTLLDPQNPSKSIQAEARVIRYAFFDEICQKRGYDYVITAHHLDDKIETALYNFANGTGLKGLGSIKGLRGNIFRPMLQTPREDINQYALENNVRWREDKSNTSTKYKRNYIRHQITPHFKEINPKASLAMGRTIDMVNESYIFIKSYLNKYLTDHLIDQGNYIVIRLAKLLAHPGYMAVLKVMLEKYHINSSQLENLNTLITEEKTGKIISEYYIIEYSRQELFISPIIVDIPFVDIIIEKLPIKVKLDKKNEIEITSSDNFAIIYYRGRNNVQFKIALNEIHFPLQIRARQEGDQIKVLGTKGHQKVKKILVNHKLSNTEKKFTYILSDKVQVYSILGIKNGQATIKI